MHKFNSIDVFTNYLKQMLHDFNLPKVKVYTTEQQEYFDQHGVERFDVLETITATDSKYPEHMRYIPYIKDGKLQEYVNGKWINVGLRNNIIGNHIHRYSYNSKLPNYTKNFRVKDNVYDSYTHEYLGDYLRFHRDYLDINLMPLYNCFSNRLCPALCLESNYLAKANSYKAVTDLTEFQEISDYLDYFILKEGQVQIPGVDNNYYVQVTQDNCKSLAIEPGTTIPYEYGDIIGEFKFDTSDTRYKIYMVPVKLFKEYTIAIDSSLPVELCCGLYGKYQDTRDKFKQVPFLTYKKIPSCEFSHPFVYSDILNLNQFTVGNSIAELAQSESELKLFIKLPVDNVSSIVILEGNYLYWNDSMYIKQKPITIDISEAGDGAPTSTPTANSTNYLDTKNKNIYKAKDGEWKFSRTIWSDPAPQMLRDGLIVDDSADIDHLWQSLYKIASSGEGEPTEAPTALYLYYWDTAANDIYQSVKNEENELYWEKIIEGIACGTGFPTSIPEATNSLYLDTSGMRIYESTVENYFSYFTTITNKRISTYSAYYNSSLKKLTLNQFADFTKHINHAVINMDALTNEHDINLITPLQLLKINTKEQMPFADRLVEYLLENAITNRPDEVADNIKRAQKVLQQNYSSNGYQIKFPGLWEYKMNKIIYDYMSKHNVNNDVNHDLLGYVDKDVEKYYASIDNKGNSTSILNAELTSEEK